MGEKLHFLSKHSEIFCFEYTGKKCQGTNLSASFFVVYGGHRKQSQGHI